MKIHRHMSLLFFMELEYIQEFIDGMDLFVRMYWNTLLAINSNGPVCLNEIEIYITSN